MYLASTLLLALLACDGASTDEAPTADATTPASASGPPAMAVSTASPDWPDAPPGPRVEIVARIEDPASGELKVRMHYRDLTEDMWKFKAMGKQSEVPVSDVVIMDADGDKLSYRKSDRLYHLKDDYQPEAIVEYTVKPGGEGRHGLQGVVTADWSTFDGRIFLLPDAAGHLRAGRLRFEAPEGWSTGSALREGDDGWLYADVYGPDLTHVALSASCFGVGPQARHVENIDGVEVRVFTPLSSSAGDRQRLDRETVAVMRWFVDELGFRPSFPMAWVWTPFRDKDRVYGGSSANGTCMEQPRSRSRAWELMAHRVAHSMNKYPPSGMVIRDERDHWFKEGWPSYVEIEATTDPGVIKTGIRWNTLYNRYLTVRSKPDEAAYDVSMLEETTCKGETCEYMHYFKGPVVVKMLDDFIIRNHGGKNLGEFMRLMYAKYGSFQSSMPLRAELEAYVGASLDPWWETFVDRRGYHYPVWEEAITPAVRSAAAKDGAAAVAGVPVSGDYLYHLAASGDFEYFADVVAFVEGEIARYEQLKAAGIELVPPDIHAVRAGFPPETRYNMARAERDWPYYPKRAPMEGGQIAWTAGDPDAEAFQVLLADERRYDEGRVGTGIEELTLHATGRAEGDEEGEFSEHPVLAFGAGSSTRLVSRWAWSPPVGAVTVGRDDSVTTQRELLTGPDWTVWRTVHKPEERPQGDGVVRYEVRGIGAGPVVRSYWQRGK